MLIVTYDFANDKTRSRFARFLKGYGEKIQYSVYQIENSPRLLRIIEAEVERNYKPFFEMTDSIMIFHVCEACSKKTNKFGSACHADSNVVLLGG
jgi:CRISPR-associated protein Cas2